MSETSSSAVKPEASAHYEENGSEEHHHVARTDKEIEAENGEIVVDAENAYASGLKLAKDGHTVLLPQPTTDPNDPLNWSSFKKHMILFIVAYSAFCGDFGSGAGIPTIVLQGEEWHLSPNHVNFAGNINVIMLGIGGLWWIPFSYFWGRAPVLFWTVLAGMLFTLGCAVTDSFTAFYGLRALMGFTLTSAQTIGLSYIKDMFYFHEHARKIGLWAAIFLSAPYFGPLVSNFIIAGTGQWRISFWVVFAACGLDLILILAFIDETWYNRAIPPEQQPSRGNRLARVLGTWQIANHKSAGFPSVYTACYRLFDVLMKPVILLVMAYYAMSFMWSVGINITTSILFETPVAEGGYGFGPRSIGFLYFTPMVAIVLAEVFGHNFNDFLARRYIHKHNGVFEPEARLWTCYIAAFFMVPGLVLVGEGLKHHLHWVALVFGWGMYVFGVLTASVAISTYALDCYPTASGEVANYVNFARVGSGFAVGYFQQSWGSEVGYDVSFGTQAVVVVVAMIVLANLQIFGKRLRAKGSLIPAMREKKTVH